MKINKSLHVLEDEQEVSSWFIQVLVRLQQKAIVVIPCVFFFYPFFAFGQIDAL